MPILFDLVELQALQQVSHFLSTDSGSRWRHAILVSDQDQFRKNLDGLAEAGLPGASEYPAERAFQLLRDFMKREHPNAMNPPRPSANEPDPTARFAPVFLEINAAFNRAVVASMSGSHSTAQAMALLVLKLRPPAEEP